MFWFVIGLPGRFSAWCESVVAELARGDGDLVQIIAANTLKQVALQAMHAGLSRGVVFSAQPEPALRQALSEAKRPCLAVLGDPQTALLELTLGQGIGLCDAVQAVAGSCAAFAGDFDTNHTLVLEPDRHAADPRATAAAIAQHLGFTVSESKLDQLAASYSDALPPPMQDAASWWNNLGKAERETVTGALAAFAERGQSPQPISVTWHHGLFFRGDRPAMRVDGPVDITGRAHALIEGPHILLPAGTWALSLGLLFSREAAEREFLVEILTSRLLASGNTRSTQEGGRTLHLEFTIDERAQHPVNIRVSSLRAAFDGTIAVAAATLVRIPPEQQSGVEPPA
jgi:hypothetical protein